MDRTGQIHSGGTSISQTPLSSHHSTHATTSTTSFRLYSENTTPTAPEEPAPSPIPFTSSRPPLPLVPPPPLSAPFLYRAKTDPTSISYTNYQPTVSRDDTLLAGGSLVHRSATLPSGFSRSDQPSERHKDETGVKDRLAVAEGLVRKRTRYPPRPLPKSSLFFASFSPTRPSAFRDLTPSTSTETLLATPASTSTSFMASRSSSGPSPPLPSIPLSLPPRIRHTSSSSSRSGGSTSAGGTPLSEGGRNWLRNPAGVTASGSGDSVRRSGASPGTGRPTVVSVSRRVGSNGESGDTERGLAEAIRASREAAELEQARKASAQAEEDLQLRLTLEASSYTAEQEALRYRRLAEEEARERQVLEDSLMEEREKKKEIGERSEKEQMELVIALSLSEVPTRQGTRPETSSEIFNRLARTDFVPGAYGGGYGGGGSSASRTPSFRLANPDPDPSERRPSPSSSNLSRGSNTTPPSLPTSSISPPRLSQSHSFSASSFYSASVAAATAVPYQTSNNSTGLDQRHPLSLTQDAFAYTYPTSSSPSTSNGKQKAEDNDDDEDPFSDKMAVLTTEDVYVSWDTTSEEDNDNKSDTDASDSQTGATSATVESAVPSSDRWDSLHPSRSPLVVQSNSTRSSSQAQHRPAPLQQNSSSSSYSSQPSHGGFVDFSNNAAIADDSVLANVKFGFVKRKNVRGGREELELEGPFPDVAQLSRMDGEGRASEEFASLAFEAASWQPLLTFLMWHGYSRIEPAPRDMQAVEKHLDGLKCAVVVDFFRNMEGKPRVRCRVDLLPLGASSASEDQRSSYSSFFPESPSITVHIPLPPQLPLLLSRLATTLSAAHTVSRSPRPGVGVGNRALRDLAAAVDLFKRLNGETVNEDAEEVEKDEAGLMHRMRGMLKRRKKGPGLVKGGADGTGQGRPLEVNRPLPEAALLVTPFRLQE